MMKKEIWYELGTKKPFVVYKIGKNRYRFPVDKMTWYPLNRKTK